MKTKELIQHIDTIKYLHTQGKTLKEIAALYNSSASTIGRLLRSFGINSRGKLTEDNLDEIIELYNTGKSLAQLGKTYHISPSTISEKFKELNVSIRGSDKCNRKWGINENYFDVIDSPNKAYILGLLYADGNNGKNHCVSISLQEKDKDILRKINIELQNDKPLKLIEYSTKNPNWSNQYQLSFTSKYMSSKLADLGMTPNKSLQLRFPTILQKNYYSHFIRGYFDGDGSIPSNQDDMHVSLVSTLDFCQVVQKILKEELNVNSSIYLCHKKDSPTRTLSIAGRIQTKRFLDYLYKDADLYLERKYVLYQLKYGSINNSLSA